MPIAAGQHWMLTMKLRQELTLPNETVNYHDASEQMCAVDHLLDPQFAGACRPRQCVRRSLASSWSGKNAGRLVSGPVALASLAGLP